MSAQAAPMRPAPLFALLGAALVLTATASLLVGAPAAEAGAGGGGVVLWRAQLQGALQALADRPQVHTQPPFRRRALLLAGAQQAVQAGARQTQQQRAAAAAAALLAAALKGLWARGAQPGRVAAAGGQATQEPATAGSAATGSSAPQLDYRIIGGVRAPNRFKVSAELVPACLNAGFARLAMLAACLTRAGACVLRLFPPPLALPPTSIRSGSAACATPSTTSITVAAPSSRPTPS
jgi:hypothetical protein